MRAALALFLLVGLPLAAQAPRASPGDQKAHALLREQLPCLGCHELDGEGGRSAPPLTTVGARRTREYIAAMIATPQAVVPGTRMPQVPLLPATRQAIVAFLARDAASGAAPPVAAVPRRALAPAEMYRHWCASCHGEQGRGDGIDARYLPVPPAAHADARAMSRRSDAALFDVIAAGGAAMGRSARMPAFGGTLSHAEIGALVRHIRTLCACEPPGWSRDPR